MCHGEGFVDAADATAFTALAAGCNHGNLDLRLEGNLNAGLLVLCCYKTWRDGSRPSCFSREYFSKQSGPWPTADVEGGSVVTDPLFHGVDVPNVLTPEPILGRWHNADRQARGLSDLSIGLDDEGIVVAATACGDIDWGQARGTLHVDIVYSKAGGVVAQARFDFGFAEVSMQIREVKGVLVTASFARFANPAQRKPTFVREFFYRHAP